MWAHNTLNSSQAAYLRCLLNYHTPTRSLRSSNTNLLSVPHVHTTFASRGFSVAAPSVWNSLPADIRACSSPHTFHCLLKTHFFKQACLRFGLWSILRTINILFTYLLTVFASLLFMPSNAVVEQASRDCFAKFPLDSPLRLPEPKFTTNR